MSNRIARWSGLMAASLLALSAGAAVAQPGHGGHGRGPGHGISIEHVLTQLKGQLGLDTSQQVMWDNAAARTKAVREAGRGSMDQVEGRAGRGTRQAGTGLRRGSGGRRLGAGEPAGVAQAGARRVAQALRHVHPCAEGGRARCGPATAPADGDVPRQDEGTHAVARAGRLTVRLPAHRRCTPQRLALQPECRPAGRHSHVRHPPQSTAMTMA